MSVRQRACLFPSLTMRTINGSEWFSVMLINLPGKVLSGFGEGILILFIVLSLMMNLALIHNSLFVRCTLQISLSSTSDPVRNRNRVFITSISQVKLLKPHIFILVYLAFWEKCLFKLGRFTVAAFLKAKRESLVIFWNWWPEVRLPYWVYWCHFRNLVTHFYSDPFHVTMDWSPLHFRFHVAEAFSMKWFMGLI